MPKPPTSDAAATSDDQAASQTSRTEIHVESHSQQHIVSGDAANAAPETVGPAGLDGEAVAAASADDAAGSQTTANVMFETQLAELEADLKRVQADFQNFKRRSGEERAELLNVAKAAVVEELLPLFDNLDRALGHKPDDLKGNAWADGVEHVAAGLPAALAKLGIERIAAAGADFDPHLHEAVAMEDGDGPREVVTEELQAGYRIGDRVLRPALVKVKRSK